MSLEDRIGNLIGQIDLVMAQSAAQKIYKWGIMGCGKISNDFANCLDKHPRAKIVACAARSSASAQKFGKRFDIAECYDSYSKLSEDKSIDIVYVGTIHPKHYECVLLCIKNGKHVLCEKPMGMNSKQVSEMIELANKNNCFLLEGMWTRFFPTIRRIKELIHKEKAIGDIIAFYGDFGVNMPNEKEVPRLWDNKLGGGALLDLGIYVVAPLTFVFGEIYPKEISSMGTIVNGIDSMTNASIKYDNNKFASIGCNFYCNSPEVHYIVGTKGRISIDSPAHAPTSFTITKFGNSIDKNNSKRLDDGAGPRDEIGNFTEKYSLPKGFRQEFIFPNSQGFYYEVDEVINCIDKGLLQSPNYTHKEMLITNQIMDEMRKQIGVKYLQDNDDVKENEK